MKSNFVNIQSFAEFKCQKLGEGAPKDGRVEAKEEKSFRDFVPFSRKEKQKSIRQVCSTGSIGSERSNRTFGTSIRY